MISCKQPRKRWLISVILMLFLAASALAEEPLHPPDNSTVPPDNATEESTAPGIAATVPELPSEVTSSGPIDNATEESTAPGIAAPVLKSPSGVMGSGQPTYTWTGVDDCLFYCLIVKGHGGTVVLKQWYNASDLPPAPADCSVTPSLLLLPGDYKWSVTSWNCKKSKTSPEMSFTVCTSSALPGKATLVSPKDTIGSKSPTFVWNAVPGCTRYCLKVSDASNQNTPIFTGCYYSEEVLSGTSCSINPGWVFAPGSYRWWVQTENCKGPGPWSNYMAFRYLAQLPGRCNPISPRGLISSSQPTFVWTAATVSERYHLELDNSTAKIADLWFDAVDVTSGSRCSALLPFALPDDDSEYFWRVRGSNDAGNGTWSGYRYFELVCPIAAKRDARLR